MERGGNTHLRPHHGVSYWHSLVMSSGSTGNRKLLMRGWRQTLLEADTNAARLALPADSHEAAVSEPELLNQGIQLMWDTVSTGLRARPSLSQVGVPEKETGLSRRAESSPCLQSWPHAAALRERALR